MKKQNPSIYSPPGSIGSLLVVPRAPHSSFASATASETPLLEPINVDVSSVSAVSRSEPAINKDKTSKPLAKNSSKQNVSMKVPKSTANKGKTATKRTTRVKKKRRPKGPGCGSCCLLVFGLVGTAIGTITFIVSVILGAKENCRQKALVSLTTQSSAFLPTTPTPNIRPILFSPESEPPERDPAEPWKYYLLPKAISPFHYNLQFTPYVYHGNEGDSLFEGKILIDAKIQLPTSFVILHASRLNVSGIKIAFVESCNRLASSSGSWPNFDNHDLFPDQGEFDAKIKRWFLYEENQFLVIETSLTLQPGIAISIGIRFEGEVRDNPGFVKIEQGMAVTSLNNKRARYVFPCFDEPLFRAYLTLSILHRPSVTVLGTMPIEKSKAVWFRSETYDSRISTLSLFQRTPIAMTTSSIAFALGPIWQSVCRRSTYPMLSNFEMCVHFKGNSSLEETAEFLLNSTELNLKWLRVFYKQQYPLPKLDIVIVSSLRSFEDYWGLIYVRLDAITITPDSNDEDRAVVRASLINALAKQWIGSMVSLRKFSSSWLVEGLAAYLEGPEGWLLRDHWTLSDQYYHGFITSKGRQAVAPNHIIDITKARSLIAMAADGFGMLRFRDVIRTFLENNRYRSTRIEGFFDILLGSKNLQNLELSLWSKHPGFPLLELQYRCAEIRRVVAVQMPISSLTLRNESVTVGSNFSWPIPIVVASPLEELAMKNKDHEHRLFWLRPQDTELTLKELNDEEQSAGSVLLNSHNLAYMRINYPQDSWIKFAKVLANNINSIEPTNRASLLDDGFELAKIGKVSYSAVFEVAKMLENETYHQTWSVFSYHVVFLNHMLSRSSFLGIFQAFAQGVSRAIRKKLVTNETFVNESIVLANEWNEAMRTQLMLAELGVVNLRSSREIECYAKYYHRDENNEYRRQLRRPVLTSHLLMNDNEETVKQMLEYSRQRSPNFPIKRDVLFAIAKTQQPWILTKLFERMLNDSSKLDDFFIIGSYACYSMQSRLFVWQWVSENFRWLRTKLQVSSTRQKEAFLRWMFDIASYFNSDTLYTDFVEFSGIAEQKLGVTSSSVRRHRDFIARRIKSNIEWMKYSRKQVESGLIDHLQYIQFLADTPVLC